MYEKIFACAVICMGCSSAVLPGVSDGGATVDAGVLRDGSSPSDPSDSGSAVDVGVPGDSGSAVDVGVPSDSGSAVDVGVPSDSGSAVDVGVPVDAPSLVGSWRAVAITVRTVTGDPLHLTDVDQLVEVDPMTGMRSRFRVNGYLTLDDTRFSMAVGLLANGYFYSIANGRTDEYSASGTTLPGLYDRASQSFAVPGAASPLRFVVMSPNRISFTSSEGGATTEYQRVDDLGGSLDRINVLTAVQLRHPMRAAPFAHPRGALWWSAPASARDTGSNNYALTFTSGYASIPTVLGSNPPEMFVFSVEGVRVAVATPVVYDDVDDNGGLDLSTGSVDVLRGVSPVAIVWIAPGQSLTNTRFRDLQPGYTLAHVHTDYTRGAAGVSGVSPFDLTNPVRLNVPVEDGRVSEPIANVLR